MGISHSKKMSSKVSTDSTESTKSQRSTSSRNSSISSIPDSPSKQYNDFLDELSQKKHDTFRFNKLNLLLLEQDLKKQISAVSASSSCKEQDQSAIYSASAVDISQFHKHHRQGGIV